MTTPTDHFGGHAAAYARFRPTYPEALYRSLIDMAPHHRLAWDCGTGNGQVALRLAQDFQAVHASDISPRQLREAPTHLRVRYDCGPAESSLLETGSVALITVAAAVHWFDLDRFFAEARRVLDPQGVLAVWSYGGTVHAPNGVGDLVRHMALEVLADDWPAGSEKVMNGYHNLPFPLREVPLKPMSLVVHWTLSDLLGYVSTWSAVPRHRSRTDRDPMASLQERLSAVWPGPPGEPIEIGFPLSCRVGKL